MAYIDAARIAGLKPLRVISDSSATALTYAFQRRKELDDKNPKLVCFVDMGHSYTSLIIVYFKASVGHILFQKSDRNLGARDIDYMICEKLAADFASKNGSNPMENKKMFQRMMEAVEKMRKKLTPN